MMKSAICGLNLSSKSCYVILDVDISMEFYLHGFYDQSSIMTQALTLTAAQGPDKYAQSITKLTEVKNLLGNDV